MSPTFTAIFFELMGLLSLWSLIKDVSTGTTTNRGTTIDVRDNPGGFYLIQFCKACFICFAVAVLLNAFGLIGDPFVWMRQNLPFLVPK